ncbi:Nif3-like dinuclear metal center hexameric protein [Ruminococcus sp.]|uniref:Nif3-like dinuclear metal center hexameric protein n=1 Tax=Ruminococcus sp. TaxID=41978 RepID=UPI0025EB685D|nr:Nif3-like dinuclear metal center hexameric protein [Ruminococcus sp.]
MMTVYDIYSFIEDIAPYRLQEGYDNSGLNVGEMSAEVKSVLVALDCTAEVAREACQRDFDLVLTHHPVIFRGLKTLSPNDPAVILAAGGKNAISMHTNFDSAEGGMNDVLCKMLGLSPSGSLHEEHGVGCGYVCDCKGFNVRELAQRAKDVLGCKVVRFNDHQREVTRAAVCSGSGGSFLSDAAAKGCQVLITGDVKHDVFIDGENMGVSIIDAGHFYTENIFCDFITELLRKNFSGLRVETAASNRDIVDII